MKKIALYLAAIAALFAVSSCDQDSPMDVRVPVENIELTLPELIDGFVEVEIGDVVGITATVTPGNATDTLTWSLQYEDVAVVVYDEADPLNHKVSIMGLKIGATTVTVSASGVEQEFRVFVKEPVIPVESIVLDIDEITISDKESVSITCSFLPEGANNTEGRHWTISDEKVVEYSWEEYDEYTVDAVAAGTAIVTCSLGEISASCTIHVVSTYVPVSSIKANSLEVNCYERFEVPVTVLPANATNKGFTFVIEDPAIISFEGVSGNTGHFIAKKEGSTVVRLVSRDQTAGKWGTFTVGVKGPKLPEGAVDLGFRTASNMPVFFRSANLGSNADIDAGMLFAWGDPSPYYYSKNPYTFREGKSDGYVEENYKWYDSKTKKYTKYTTNGDVLSPEDDPAHVILGGKWYMPTTNEMLFLYNNCDKEETTKNGIHGMTFKSQMSGFKGASIFLPCGGYLTGVDNLADGNFEDWTGKKYYMGCYQTSNVFCDEHDGFFGFLFQNGKVYVRKEPRYIGESIRPIWRGYAD